MSDAPTAPLDPRPCPPRRWWQERDPLAEGLFAGFWAHRVVPGGRADAETTVEKAAHA